MSAYAWMPVFFLYFRERLALDELLRLEAIYYAAVVITEVPSGYASDRFGRRGTLLAAALVLMVAYGAFVVADSFATLALAQVLMAMGLAGLSGTNTSFHFDSLVWAGQRATYDAREAVVSRVEFVAAAAAALVGGGLGYFDLRWPYIASGVAALGAVLIAVFGFCEPEAHSDDAPAARIDRQLMACVRLTTRRPLGWLLAAYVVATVVNHVPWEFVQPYLRDVLDELSGRGSGETSDTAFGEASFDDAGSRDLTPLWAGVHAAGAMLIASWFAGKSIAWRDRVGLAGAMLSGIGLQVVLIALMAWIVHPVVAVLLLLRSVPRGLIAAPINAAVTPVVGRGLRATYLSMQSLAGRLSFSVFLLVLSGLAGHDDSARALMGATMFGVVALVGLAVFGGKAKAS